MHPVAVSLVFNRKEKMYYLNLHKLYKQTNKTDRVIIRQQLNRNENMERALKMQRGNCFFCGEPTSMAGHLDHLIPVYYGGSNNKSNLVATCSGCNLTKSTDQIEILNSYTIYNYQNLQHHRKKMIAKYNRLKKENKSTRNVYKGKKYRLYKLYRADLFTEV